MVWGELMCGAKRRIWPIILPRRKLSILSKNLKALLRFTKIDFLKLFPGFLGKNAKTELPKRREI